MNPSGMLGIARDQELAADGVGGLAVHAGSCLGAGRIETESLRVDRRRHISCSLHRTVYIITDLVHACDHDDFAGALCKGGNAVRVAVDIDHIAARLSSISSLSMKL